MATNKGTGRLATGRFATRADLTCHVWSMYRQQVFPNIRAIAGACGVTMQVVRAVVDSKEGLSDYLERGCLTGMPAVAVRR
jgi:hypothetical protein